jgi:hypothetical protein
MPCSLAGHRIALVPGVPDLFYYISLSRLEHEQAKTRGDARVRGGGAGSEAGQWGRQWGGPWAGAVGQGSWAVSRAGQWGGLWGRQ